MRCVVRSTSARADQRIPLCVVGRGRGAQVVHSHARGPVSEVEDCGVEHCGQNQRAHAQPHCPLHSFPLKS